MIFYTIKAEDVIVDWAGTQAEAKAATKVQGEKHVHDAVTWEEHDVPTDKPSLLAWLKVHAVGLGNEQVEQLAELLHLGQPETPAPTPPQPE